VSSARTISGAAALRTKNGILNSKACRVRGMIRLARRGWMRRIIRTMRSYLMAKDDANRRAAGGDVSIPRATGECQTMRRDEFWGVSDVPSKA